tara:strand:- start:263 stop:409 length:147 start_codon:yes stop_codon:yes gene_type:complete
MGQASLLGIKQSPAVGMSNIFPDFSSFGFDPIVRKLELFRLYIVDRFL